LRKLAKFGYHRIEVCIAINNIPCKNELIDYFELQWHDDDKIVELSPTQEQHRVTGNSTRMNAQQSIYHYLQQKV